MINVTAPNTIQSILTSSPVHIFKYMLFSPTQFYNISKGVGVTCTPVKELAGHIIASSAYMSLIISFRLTS